MKILLVDNYDSYTWNLFQQLARVGGCEPVVFANDAVTLDQVRALAVDAIVLSPGPGHPARPRDFGVCAALIRELDLPILGVCLGHQGLAVAAGGRVGHAPEPVHGRTSALVHDGLGLFEGVPQGVQVVRYHSLAVHEPVPSELEVVARTAEGVIMALRHRRRPQWGVQFHPESIATEHGDTLVANFLRLSAAHRAAAGCPVVEPVAPPPRPAPPPSGAALPVHVRTLPGGLDAELAFAALYADHPRAFWLDSASRGDGRARFSILGAADGPDDLLVRYDVDAGAVVVERGAEVRVEAGSIFDWLRAALAERPCAGAPVPVPGFVGVFGYELRGALGSPVAHPSDLPDVVLLRVDRHLVVDEQTGAAHLVAVGDGAAAAQWFDTIEARLAGADVAPPRAGTRRSLAFRLAHDRRTYLDSVDACLDAIVEGESYELCLTTRLVGPPLAHPLDAYRVLRRRNPAPYGAFLRVEQLALLSSSPELFLRAEAGGTLVTKPIKGTRGRSRDPDVDAALREDLRTSDKDRAENLMIVDLLRNDLGRVCEVGSVRVPALMQVESYETVHQLVSTVTGQLRPDLTVVDALAAVFPGGSMTGAPKLRTMEILDRLEGVPRGPYAGCLGRLGGDGTADLSIVIRSAVCTPDACRIGVGGAVVALSDPETELAEAVLKGRAVVEALAEAETGRPDAYEIIGLGEPESIAGKG